MALPWLTVLKMVPWGDVIRNAPKVAEGAKKLWGTVSKKPEATRYQAPPSTSTAVLETDAQTLTRLQRQVAVHQSELADLHAQLVETSEVVQQLADQNVALVRTVERQRLQLRWLAAGVLLTLAGLAVLLLRS